MTTTGLRLTALHIKMYNKYSTQMYCVVCVPLEDQNSTHHVTECKINVVGKLQVFSPKLIIALDSPVHNPPGWWMHSTQTHCGLLEEISHLQLSCWPQSLSQEPLPPPPEAATCPLPPECDSHSHDFSTLETQTHTCTHKRWTSVLATALVTPFCATYYMYMYMYV